MGVCQSLAGLVLVVEDEDVIRELIVEVLRKNGFDVDEASTADDADRLIDADGYRLLVTDIHVPGYLDGIDLAEKAHQRKPGLPILFVTGRPDVLQRLSESGMVSACIPKPFRLATLTAAVRGLLEEAGMVGPSQDA